MDKLSILSVVRKIASAALVVTMAVGCSLVSSYKVGPTPVHAHAAACPAFVCPRRPMSE